MVGVERAPIWIQKRAAYIWRKRKVKDRARPVQIIERSRKTLWVLYGPLKQ